MISGELDYWRDVALNLLTDSQLDTRMPNSGLTPREVLSKVRRDEQVLEDFGIIKGCPYCKFTPHGFAVVEYCTIHQPIKVIQS